MDAKEAAAVLGASGLSVLSPEQLRLLPPDVVAALSEEQLVMLEPQQLVALSKEQLEGLSPEQLLTITGGLAGNHRPDTVFPTLQPLKFVDFALSCL
eukprot:scaffold461971_cov47-Prasinocladus_malaysianus.AAC.1